MVSRSEVDLGVKALLILHAAAAIVLIGRTTHGGLLALAWLRGRPGRPKLQRIYAAVTAWTYGITFVLGVVLYPPFRLDVRAAYLDRELPLASAFFEVKEHWLAIGLFVIACCWSLRHLLGRKEREPLSTLAHLLAVTLVPVVWLAMFTGLALTAIRPVGGT